MEEVYLEIHELYDFFRKYDINELEILSIILDYVKSFDTSIVNSVFNNVYDEKDNDYLDEPEAEFNCLDILNKNHLLTKKELYFLYSVIYDAAAYLNTLDEFSDYFVDDEQFDVSEFPIEELNELATKLAIFIDERDSEVLTR